jgi:hypothetical protein
VDNRPRCTATKQDGNPCQAPALPGETLCWAHSPTTAEARDQARVRGGETRRRPVLPEDAPAVELRKLGDVLTLVSQTVTQARRGSLDVKVANVCLYGASIAARVIQDDIEKRVEQLEETVKLLQHAAGRNGHHEAHRPVVEPFD